MRVCSDRTAPSRTPSESRLLLACGDRPMIRLGVVDFDTSHATEFTRRLNHVDITEDQWVEGARVVAGVPGESKIAPERIPEYTAEMEKYGVTLYHDPADLFGKVDAVLIV